MKINVVVCLWLSLLLVPVARGADDWKLVWHDEFDQDGAPDPANWDYERGFVRNGELQWYQPENAYCTNGFLIIEARPEHKKNPWYDPGSPGWKTSREWIDYTSASLITRGLHEFKYGKFEMRARINTRRGSWPAFWALGVDRQRLGWPACGEIDIMEYYTGEIRANIAYLRGGQGKWSAKHKPIMQLGGDAWSNAFHIWTMEWDGNKIDLLLDGKMMNHYPIATADDGDKGNPFHLPFFLILNQAIGSTGGDPSQTPFPIRFEVDWVRVYQHG